MEKSLLLKLKKNKIALSPWIEDYLLKQTLFLNIHKSYPCALYKIHLKKGFRCKKRNFFKRYI